MTNPDWDVYRDAQGNPVTITEEQMHAIWHAIRVVERVRRAEDYPSMWTNPEPNLYKSRLLGRLLIDGRPPLDEKPPDWWGGCGYHIVEGTEIGHYYFGPTPIPGRIEAGKFTIDPDDPRAAGRD